MSLVGIISFNSKSIVTDGKKTFFPFTSFDKTQVYLVASKKKTNTAHWAIVAPLNSDKASIVEILGAVHQIEIERQALLRHYQVLPRRYPKSPDFKLKDLPFEDLTHLDAFSIDSESTLDVDDCISITESTNETVIGIYIALVGGYFPPDSLLGKHVLEHCSSVYTSTKEYPLLHPDLSHGEFSLLQGRKRKVIALKIHLRDNQVVKKEHCYAIIINKDKTTYKKFDQDRRKGVLSNYTGKTSSEDIVAQLMIEYNSYFGSLTKLIRIQNEDMPAKYVINNGENPTLHTSLGIHSYAHATSPIRRIADIITQWQLIYGEDILESINLQHINEHCLRITHSHRDTTLLDLVYQTKKDTVETKIRVLEKNSKSFKGEVELPNSKIRVWFPITNSLLSELETPLLDEFVGTIHGYHQGGFPKLRVKFASTTSTTTTSTTTTTTTTSTTTTSTTSSKVVSSD